MTTSSAIRLARHLEPCDPLWFEEPCPRTRWTPMARDARMFTIGGGTAQILRTVVASRILDRKLPQTRDGFSRLAAMSGRAEGTTS